MEKKLVARTLGVFILSRDNNQLDFNWQSMHCTSGTGWESEA